MFLEQVRLCLLYNDNKLILIYSVSKRTMSEHNLFPIQPSRWHWKKFKDYLHFYVMIGVIPATAIVAFSNIFIGPATLAEIPKGCEPEHWEYYRVNVI